MEDFSGDGLFWLPDEPDNKVAGRLTFSAKAGASLELIGDLAGARQSLSGLSNSQEPQRIVGIAGRKQVTLEKCLLGNTVMNAHGTTLTTFHPQFVLAGAHFDADEPLRFYAIAVSLTHLQTWTHHVGTSVEFPSTVPSNQFTLRYRKPPDQTVRGTLGTMTLGALWDPSGDHIERSSFTFDAYIKIERGDDSDLVEDLLPLSSRLQALVTLAVDTVSYPTHIWLWHRDLDVESPSSNPLELWFHHAGTAEPTSKRLIGPDMLFTYKQFGGLEGVYHWLEYADKYRAVVGALLANRYRPTTFIENRFVNAVVAAEAFDRSRFTNEVIPKPQFRAMRDEIVALVPDERRAWLTEQLAYSNEPRLRYRLKRMADHIGPEYRNMVGDVEAWARAATKCRNDIAHGRSVKLPPGVSDKGAYIYWLTESLMTLVVLCLVKECRADEAIEHLASNERIKFAGRHLRKMLVSANAEAEGEDEGADDSSRSSDEGADDSSRSSDEGVFRRYRRWVLASTLAYVAVRVLRGRH